jgi:hypothetical protein
MLASPLLKPDECNCFMVRSAARHVTMSLARALIVRGPSRFNFAKIENCVTCSPTGARVWS